MMYYFYLKSFHAVMPPNSILPIAFGSAAGAVAIIVIGVVFVVFIVVVRRFRKKPENV